MSSSASQQQILRLALAQVHPSEGDIEDAFAKLRSYARRASQAGADVVSTCHRPPPDIVRSYLGVKGCLSRVLSDRRNA